MHFPKFITEYDRAYCFYQCMKFLLSLYDNNMKYENQLFKSNYMLNNVLSRI